MLLDVSICQNPDENTLDALVSHKLQMLHALEQPPGAVYHADGAHCYLLNSGGLTELVAVHASNAEQALNAALIAHEQLRLSAAARITIFSPEPPPGLAWLSQGRDFHWWRCRVLAIGNDFGLLLENQPGVTAPAPASAQASALDPGRLQRESAVTEENPTDLTEEEQQFFSHL